MTALAKNFLVKNCDPTYENIEQFIVGKSLENFIAESLKIHVDYQIAINNQEKPSYSEDVLEKIKRLDQLTLHLTIPSASRRNCVNELDLNQMTTPFTVKANVGWSDCSFNAIDAPITALPRTRSTTRKPIYTSSRYICIWPDIPEHVPNFIKEIINNCWKHEPQERPKADYLNEALKNELAPPNSATNL
ncbi:hypothetical protein C2G38_2207105 [Gigaspora rosea]|uniref:Serine-threonine/tyrosine-protein kinase catalytic domain-containing protein n=1 Tax=Gigaspora rosea TaxID=44941 RepID=A0A397UKT2_9GLOM|nr:hypothetical protein C2G38_2207105 [Gigaspora rosea]